MPRSGKLWGLYKQGGHRIVINKMGDLVVRPSPLEASLRQIPAGDAASFSWDPGLACFARPDTVLPLRSILSQAAVTSQLEGCISPVPGSTLPRCTVCLHSMIHVGCSCRPVPWSLTRRPRHEREKLQNGTDGRGVGGAAPAGSLIFDPETQA